MANELDQLKKELAEERKARLEEKAFRGSLEAKLEVLLQMQSARSEPERLQLAEKQELQRRRDAVRKVAIKVAMETQKVPEKKVTHVRYVIGAYYQRKGVLYPPGKVLKIPVSEQPAVDWQAWQPPRMTKPVAIDPDAGVPFGELRSSTSAIAATRRDEAAAMADAQARGDVVINSGAAVDNMPDQGEMQPPATEQPPADPGPEAGALSPRASDTDVG